MVDNREFLFPGIGAFECQTGHSTTGLVSAVKRSKAVHSELAFPEQRFLNNAYDSAQ